MQRAAEDNDIWHVAGSRVPSAIEVCRHPDLLAQRLVVAVQRAQPAVLPCGASSAAPLPAAAS